MLRAAFVLFLAQLVQITEVQAWGPEGHSVIAEIAQRRLTPSAQSKIRMILGDARSLASFGSWADDYRALHPSTASWHFVDIPLSVQDYDEARDCPNGGCIVDALQRSVDDLKNESLPNEKRAEALKFVVHFVGDINQPLHTVKEMQGYNEFPVCYFSSPAKNDCVETNLHAVWDSGLIRSIFWDWGAYADYLESKWMVEHDISSLSDGSTVVWALEAHQAARDVVVSGLRTNEPLGREYLDAVRPTLDRQLAAAGLRLARVLNDALN
jgi:hypothetical protein